MFLDLLENYIEPRRKNWVSSALKLTVENAGNDEGNNATGESY
jgi:hypothetical protein